MTSIRRRTWTAPNGEEKTAWLVDYKDAAGTRRAKQFDRKKDAEREFKEALSADPKHEDARKALDRVKSRK